MKKFIRLENTILNIDNIESVSANYRTIKYGDEWYDKDEKAEDGVVVIMTNKEQPYVFTTVTLDKFMELLNEH